MFGMHWFPFHWFGGFGSLGTVAVIIIVIILITRSHRYRDERRPSNAEQILKERLARGEIDEETYESLLKKIR